MIKTGQIRTMLLILISIISESSWARDGLEDTLRRKADVPCFWDNIERRSRWVGGKPPERSIARGRHEVLLRPGEYTCVRIPAFERLRVSAGRGDLNVDDLEVTLSNGSGLLVSTRGEPDPTTGSLLFDPRSAKPTLAYLTRLPNRQSAISVALHTSRHEPLQDIVRYRDLIQLSPTRRVRLRNSREADSLEYWQWNRHDGAKLQLRGPARFRLETRYRYIDQESDITQPYRISIHDLESKTPLMDVAYLASLETSELIEVDNAVQLTGQKQDGFFDLPEDRLYQVALQSSAPVYLRLLQLDTADYLLPGRNKAPVSDEWLVNRTIQESPWDLSAQAINEIMWTASSRTIEEIDRVSFRLARDNAIVEGGMMASNLIWDTCWNRRDYPRMRAQWNDYAFATFYRNATPSNGVKGGFSRAFFTTRDLLTPGREQNWNVINQSLIRSAFGRIPEARFSRLQPGESLQYVLPERHTPTTIRVVAHRNPMAISGFKLTVEGQPPRSFLLLPEPDANSESTKPSIGESALHFFPGGTLDNPAAFMRSPAETVSAGSWEFRIPPEARRLELSQLNGLPELPVALQYRTSKPYLLTEDEYLDFSRGIPETELFRWCLDCISKETPPAPSGSRARRELCNHWEPLRRLLQSRWLQFTHSHEGVAMPDQAIEALDQLEEEGEFFLAERLARSLFLSSSDPSTRNRAFEYLDELAIRKGDPDLMILNASVKLLSSRDRSSAIRLASLLREKGETKLALMLALAIPAGADTAELRLATTYLNRWWKHFDGIEGPSPPYHIWNGIRHWQSGDRKKALEHWHAAGYQGVPWISHTKATSRARSRIMAGDPAGIRDWAKAEVEAPGLHLWKPVGIEKVQSYSESRIVKLLERGKHQTSFVATPNDPVRLVFQKPGLIKIECRPIHPADATSPIEGWISVTRDGQTLSRVPVLSNFPSSGIQFEDNDSEVPGTKLSETIALNDWNNHLTIVPEFGPSLVRVSRWEPEVRAGYLPGLDESTAGWLFNPGAVTNRGEVNLDHGKIAIVGADHSVTWEEMRSPHSQSSPESITKVKQLFRELDPISINWPDAWQFDVIAQMRQSLTEFQTGNPEKIRRAIATASYLWRRHQNIPELRPIHSAITRQCYWEPLLSVDSNAGLREIETPGWEPETPSLLTRMRFLPPLGPAEQLVTGLDSTVALFNWRERNRVTVNLALECIPFLRPEPLRARIEVAGQTPVDIEFSEQEDHASLDFDLPKGRSSIRVTITDNVPNQYLKVGLASEEDPESLIRKTVRSWFVSYHSHPLSVSLDGPAWVRVDQMTPRGVESAYHHVTGEVGHLNLVPEGNEGLYRIHVLRMDPDKPYLAPAYTKRDVNAQPLPVIVQPIQSQPLPVSLAEDPLNHEEIGSGTWSAGLSYHQRRFGYEDFDETLESFGQGDLTYRYYDEDRRTWFRSTFLGRGREEGEPTFGVEQSLYHNPVDSPFNYSFKGSLFEQGGEWSLSGKGTISLTGDLNPKLKHTTSASLFGRIHSLDQVGPRPEEIDRDIFTTYQDNHSRGLRLEETLTYTPWQDTRFFAGVGLKTNENFVTPDYFNYRIGVEQLVGRFRLGAELAGYQFFDDDNRTSHLSRHRLNLDAVGDFWTRNQRRFEAGVRYSHYFEEDENSISLFGRWHFGQGGRFRDFRPGEESFTGIRERNLPAQDENRIHSSHDQKVETDH